MTARVKFDAHIKQLTCLIEVFAIKGFATLKRLNSTFVLGVPTELKVKLPCFIVLKKEIIHFVFGQFLPR